MSIKSFCPQSCVPPPPEKVSVLRIFYWYLQFFLILVPFPKGGVKPHFANKNFTDTQTLLNKTYSRCNTKEEPSVVVDLALAASDEDLRAVQDRIVTIMRAEPPLWWYSPPNSGALLSSTWSAPARRGRWGGSRWKNVSGFFPLAGTWVVRPRSVTTSPDPQLSADSPHFRTGFFRVLTGFFPGFNRDFSGFLKNLEKTWFNFHRPPPWPTLFGGPRHETTTATKSVSSKRCSPPNPKDPSVLKIVRRANSLRREKNATARAKRYGECSEVLVFLGKRGRKTVWKVKNYGGSKMLRIRAPYYF